MANRKMYTMECRKVKKNIRHKGPIKTLEDLKGDSRLQKCQANVSEIMMFVLNVVGKIRSILEVMKYLNERGLSTTTERKTLQKYIQQY